MTESFSTLRAKYDSRDLSSALRAFPDHCSVGWKAAEALPEARQPWSSVVICGMGGSAISGDLARTLMLSRSTVPVMVHRNYGLPAWVGEDTLVVILSYSGGTEESLSAFEEATARNAGVIAVTTGGRLGERCGDLGFPVVAVPGGLPPRYALGYLFFALLGALRRNGVLLVSEEEREAALETVGASVARCADEEAQDNPAVLIARDLLGALPVLYAGDETLGAVAYRWRCQFNENAKVLALHHVLPEMNHNEIVGWENEPGRLAECVVLALRDTADRKEIGIRMDLSLGIIRPHARKVLELRSTAIHPLGRMLELICLGDWVSYYLALLLNTDPFPIANIETLKRGLSSR